MKTEPTEDPLELIENQLYRIAEEISSLRMSVDDLVGAFEKAHGLEEGKPSIPYPELCERVNKHRAEAEYASALARQTLAKQNETIQAIKAGKISFNQGRAAVGLPPNDRAEVSWRDDPHYKPDGTEPELKEVPVPYQLKASETFAYAQAVRTIRERRKVFQAPDTFFPPGFDGAEWYREAYQQEDEGMRAYLIGLAKKEGLSDSTIEDALEMATLPPGAND